jgi:lysophospholipase L1-like esterase
MTESMAHLTINRRVAGYITAAVLAAAMLAAPTPVGSAEPTTWCTALAAGSPTVDVLGDSLSYGDSVADPARRWHAMLGDSLRSDGAPGTQVWIGGAIPGSATADYLPGAKYEGHIQFTANHPSLIIMGWGTNDWSASIPPATFQAQYQQIIDRIRVLSPNSTLLLVHMPWVYNLTLTATRGPQDPYRDAIRALADVNHTAYFGDEFGYDGVDYYHQSTSDLVHLNENGQHTQYFAMRAFILGMCQVVNRG